jgi:hypothetical protein
MGDETARLGLGRSGADTSERVRLAAEGSDVSSDSETSLGMGRSRAVTLKAQESEISNMV